MLGHFSKESISAISHALGLDFQEYSEGLFDFKVCEKGSGEKYGIPDTSECGGDAREVKEKASISLFSNQERSEVLSKYENFADKKSGDPQYRRGANPLGKFIDDYEAEAKDSLKNGQKEGSSFHLQTLNNLASEPAFKKAVLVIVPIKAWAVTAMNNDIDKMSNSADILKAKSLQKSFVEASDKAISERDLKKQDIYMDKAMDSFTAFNKLNENIGKAEAAAARRAKEAERKAEEAASRVWEVDHRGVPVLNHERSCAKVGKVGSAAYNRCVEQAYH